MSEIGELPDYNPDGSANPKGDASYWRFRAEAAEAERDAAREEAEAGRRYVAALIEAMDAEQFCALVETGAVDGIRAWQEGGEEWAGQT